jgi:DNA (cytosine-5)-methyltransferase 1
MSKSDYEKDDLQFTIAETFVGAGGAHLGFKNAGFKTTFVNDIDNDTIQTLIQNNAVQEDQYLAN